MTKAEHEKLLAETKAVIFEPAYADRMLRLRKKVGDNWALCEFGAALGMTRRCAEAEVMVAQTIHATGMNLQSNGMPYSFRGNGVFGFYGAGIVDNGTAYGHLIGHGFFVEEQIIQDEVKSPPKDTQPDDGKYTVIYMTEKLLDVLEAFLKLKAVKREKTKV